MKNRLLCTVGTVVILGFLAASPLHAHKAFLNRIKPIYELNKDINGNCFLCHTYDKDKKENADKTNINAMGKALQAHPKAKIAMKKGDAPKFKPEELEAFEVAFKELENADTDGDGATNLEELKLGTFPGEKASAPKKEELEKLRKK